MKKKLLMFSGVMLAAMLMLLGGQRPVTGKEDPDDHAPRRLAGTWNVTLHFPECTPQCTCPGGIPNIPIPALQTYSSDESILETGGGSLFRGPGLGSWEHAGGSQFTSRFKFFIFNPDGTRKGSEEVTNHIDLTGPDTFESAATFDLFDAKGNPLAAGCPINETATRFE